YYGQPQLSFRIEVAKTVPVTGQEWDECGGAGYQVAAVFHAETQESESKGDLARVTDAIQAFGRGSETYSIAFAEVSDRKSNVDAGADVYVALLCGCHKVSAGAYCNNH